MSKKWWNRFLSGVIGTSIGVGLTFAVNGMWANHKKAEAQWQTAMMAIYDIDKIAQQIEEYRYLEETFFKVTMYLQTHQEEIATVSIDSLRMAVCYLVEDPSVIPAFSSDSKENAFTNGMDAFQNLENIQFYDNVQECYQVRRELLSHMEQSIGFKRPISQDFIARQMERLKIDDIGPNGNLSEEVLAKILQDAFQQDGIAYFLRKYFSRNSMLVDAVNKLERLNQENKMLMNITDEDMEDFIRNNVDRTKPATARLIVGQWKKQQTDQPQTYCLNKDNSATMTSHFDFNLMLQVKEENLTISVAAPVTYTIKGQWELSGDSLRLDFDTNTVNITSFDFDLTSLPKAVLEREKDSLDYRKQECRNVIQHQIKQAKWSWANKVAIGKTGGIMIWESQYTLPWGQVKTNTEHLLKKE